MNGWFVVRDRVTSEIEVTASVKSKPMNGWFEVHDRVKVR